MVLGGERASGEVFPPSEDEYAARIAVRAAYCAIVIQGVRSVDPHGAIPACMERFKKDTLAGLPSALPEEGRNDVAAAWSLLRLQEGLVMGDPAVLRCRDAFDETNAPLAQLRNAATICGLYDAQNDELSAPAIQASPLIYDLNKSVTRRGSIEPAKVVLAALRQSSAPAALLDEFRTVSRLSRARGKLASACLDPEDTKALLAAYEKQPPEGVTSEGSLVFSTNQILGRKPRVVAKQLPMYRALPAHARFTDLHRMLIEDMHAMVGSTTLREG